MVELQLVGQGALDHRESRRERRDKIFAAKTENGKIFKTGKQFSVGILAAGKLTFGGGV